MLNHVDSRREVNYLAKKMAMWDIKIRMAKVLFWVSAGIAVVVWAIKS